MQAETCASPRVAFRTFIFLPPPAPERGQVLGWSTNEDEHGSPHMDHLRGSETLPQNIGNKIACLPWCQPGPHISTEIPKGIYEQIGNTGGAESCMETLFLKNKTFIFFLKKLHTHVQICSTFKTCLSFQTNCVLLSMQDPTAA